MLLLGRVGNAPVAAQEVSIKIPVIAVIDEQERHYDIGEALQLNSRAADLRRAGGSQNLRVRIMRGSTDDLLHRFRNRSADGCLLYPSSLFRAKEYDGGIKIQTVDKRDGSLVDVVLTEKWLGVSADRRIRDQRYVLVFEIAEHEEEILKLREEDVEPYLKIGFNFVVRAPEQPLDAARVEAIMLAESSARDQAAAKIRAAAGTRAEVAEAIDVPSGGGRERPAAGRPKKHARKVPRHEQPPAVPQVRCAAYTHLEFERIATLVSVPCACAAAEAEAEGSVAAAAADLGDR
ncbi:MAG TPA: hypothetical protein VHR45_03745 [Thermoanaerobaculia bacterium]|nr:hypothetical protein [Thermoanaerobaculia bacterium]